MQCINKLGLDTACQSLGLTAAGIDESFGAVGGRVLNTIAMQ